MTLKIVRNILDLRKETAKWRSERLSSAVVPTMGALHPGHITLVREGLEHADRVVTTIFVNPKQFAVNEDLGRYPAHRDVRYRPARGKRVPISFSPRHPKWSIRRAL